MAAAAPLLASKFAIPAIGAVAGAAMNKGNPLQGAMMGGLGGAALGPMMSGLGAAGGAAQGAMPAALASGNVSLPFAGQAAQSGMSGLLSNLGGKQAVMAGGNMMLQGMQPQQPMPQPMPMPVQQRQQTRSMMSLGQHPQQGLGNFNFMNRGY